jgi:hypothetical protein
VFLLFTNIQEEFYGNSGKVLATENPNTNSPKASQPSHFPQDSKNTTNNDNLKPSIFETRNLNLIKKSAQLGLKFVILKPRCDIVAHAEAYTPDPQCIDAINREIISIHEKPNELNLSICTSKTKRLSLPSGICKWASVWGSSRWIQCVPWHS